MLVHIHGTAQVAGDIALVLIGVLTLRKDLPAQSQVAVQIALHEPAAKGIIPHPGRGI